MSKLIDLKTARAAVGANYAAAAQSYLSAYEQLAAHDSALSNAAVGGGPQAGFDGLPTVQLHGEFLRECPEAGRIAERAGALAEALVNAD